MSAIQKLVTFYIFDKVDKVEVAIGNDTMYIAKKAYAKTKENCEKAGYTVRCDNEYLLNA